MYYNCCKYARSNNPSKFKLTGTKNGQAEAMVEDVCQRLATSMSKLYKAAAPDAHQNQVAGTSLLRASSISKSFIPALCRVTEFVFIRRQFVLTFDLGDG